MRISIIIPTLQAEKYLPDLLDSLKSQSTQSDEIILIDSSSTDQTSLIARENNCHLIRIKREIFRHGKARNLGANQASGDILIFLTQDALPANEYFLEELTQPIKSGLAVAANARQVPKPDATPLEKYSREYNYPKKSYIRTWQDVERRGIKAVYFSNVASAYNREVFWSIGGFSEYLIVNEDMNICTRLLLAGYSVAYQSQAIVNHSHNFSHPDIFRRYFDIGVSFKQDKELLSKIPVSNEGLNYLKSLRTKLLSTGHASWLPALYFEAITKFIGFNLGKKYHFLPVWLRRNCSGHPLYWLQSKPSVSQEPKHVV